MSRKLLTGFVSVGAMVVVLFVFGLLHGCGGGDGGTGTPTGTLQVSLTDKASDDLQTVVVTIKEVRVVPAGKEGASDDDPGLPVIATFASPRTVDIMTLRFQQEALGSVVIPAGIYNQVRLVLEPNLAGHEPVNYIVPKSDPALKIPLKTPSGQQSGLKVLGKFEVKPGVINAIMLDFDPNTAIVARGNGDFNLKPTGIRIVQLASVISSFGSLSGMVSALQEWSSATVSVVPRRGSSAIAAGAVFSNFSSGRFQAPFSAFVPAGTYRVHVQAPGFQPYSSSLQDVAEWSDIPLGTITLQPTVP